MNTKDRLVGEQSFSTRFWILTFQSSEHFFVTPTVSFNLTTPVVFFRFFMQPRKAGVEMLNLIWGTKKEDVYQTRLVWELELKLSTLSATFHPWTGMYFMGFHKNLFSWDFYNTTYFVKLTTPTSFRCDSAFSALKINIIVLTEEWPVSLKSIETENVQDVESSPFQSHSGTWWIGSILTN